MTWRVPPFDRAADEAEAFIHATWNVHGIVVSGSIVRGEAGPTSDLDIVIVHREPWRLRDQRRFNGVPAELFVNPPDRIRGYFKTEHVEGRPCTAHMFVTGEVLAGADDIVHELVREANDWTTRPLELTADALTRRRYCIVDGLDDARDAIALGDPASAALLLAEAVRGIVAYAFLSRGLQQGRRKSLVRELAAIDPLAAEQLVAFTTTNSLDVALAMANHVLGVDTFFEWTSDRS